MNSVVDYRPQTASGSIAVLEWISGGGLLDQPLGNIPASLRREGCAMLQTLVTGLAAAGFQVLVPVDQRLFEAEQISGLAAVAQVIPLTHEQGPPELRGWHELSTRCTWTWLVAPELADQLPKLASALRSSGGQLLNASHDFLWDASDKRRTAERLLAAGVPHPPTCALSGISPEWLETAHAVAYAQLGVSFAHSPLATQERRWCVKPADGAGCVGLQILGTAELLKLCTEAKQINSDNQTNQVSHADQASLGALIVQPWLTGSAASCSLFVDPTGKRWWLPLVSQDFDSAHAYLGCTLSAPQLPQRVSASELEPAIHALRGQPLGWIGLDLLFEPTSQKFWVIEINPRCTTSMVGLAEAYQGELIRELCSWQATDLQLQLNRFAPSVYRL